MEKKHTSPMCYKFFKKIIEHSDKCDNDLFSLIQWLIIMYSWAEFWLMVYFSNFSHKFAGGEIIFIESVFMLGFDIC